MTGRPTQPEGLKMSISEQLRQAMFDSGLSYYRLARDTDMDHASLVRFGNKERGLILGSVDRLADYLGLELRPIKEAKKSKGQRP
jgi:hypothetical protein